MFCPECQYEFHDWVDECNRCKIALVPSIKTVIPIEFELVTIATFDNSVDAYLNKSKLEANGIQTFIEDEFIVTMDWFYSNAIGGIKLKVKEKEADTAKRIISSEPKDIFLAQETGNDDWKATQCPNCKSYSVKYEKYSRRFALLAMFICGLPLLYTNEIWSCFACKAKWDNDGRLFLSKLKVYMEANKSFKEA